jgi:hydroxyquinol 1,2-dioxygenase
MTAVRDLEGAELTKEAVESFAATADARTRQLLQSLVRHLHAFADEVGLTEQEWLAGIDFLTRTGQLSDETRQEFVLLSAVLGLSMLVVGMGRPRVRGDGLQPTAATVLGPFFVEGAPEVAAGDDIARDAPGEPCFADGTVLSTDGSPLAGALVEVWQADEAGLYDVQYADLDGARARGRLRTDADGRFRFRTVKPEPYPIPTDGPVGELLAATSRSPMRPAPIHFMASAPGHETVVTHVFVEGDPYLDSDAVFGVRDSLVATFSRHGGGDPSPDGTMLGEPFSTVTCTIVLAPSPGRRGDGPVDA